MTELHETRMGQTLVTNTLPELVRQITRLADAVERLADLHVQAGSQQQPLIENQDDAEERSEAD